MFTIKQLSLIDSELLPICASSFSASSAAFLSCDENAIVTFKWEVMVVLKRVYVFGYLEIHFAKLKFWMSSNTSPAWKSVLT